jgi:hypothetical protein
MRRNKKSLFSPSHGRLRTRKRKTSSAVREERLRREGGKGKMEGRFKRGREEKRMIGIAEKRKINNHS